MRFGVGENGDLGNGVKERKGKGLDKYHRCLHLKRETVGKRVTGKMLELNHLPTVNAFLNTASAVLLVCGYISIRKGKVKAHRAFMIGAMAASALFFASYLLYHAQVGATKFAGTGWIRPVYFAILISHTLLAAAIVPMALITLYRALRGNFQSHRSIARWTLPFWLYVSVTGVLIYLMLYHWFPSR